MEDIIVAVVMMVVVFSLIPLYLWRRRLDSAVPHQHEEEVQDVQAERVVRGRNNRRMRRRTAGSSAASTSSASANVEVQHRDSIARNTKIKAENSVKVEPSDAVKDGNANNNNSSSVAAMGANGSVPNILVKEDTVKSIFTDNLQTTGAYSAREESLKREIALDASVINFGMEIVEIVKFSEL